MAEPSKPLRFNREMRLQASYEFAAIRNKGQRLVKGCLIANWVSLPESAHSKLGVITSRKIGGSVVRSRARRLLREAFRRHQHEFAAISLVLVARNSIADKDYAGVEKDFLRVLADARLLKPE